MLFRGGVFHVNGHDNHHNCENVGAEQPHKACQQVLHVCHHSGEVCCGLLYVWWALLLYVWWAGPSSGKTVEGNIYFGKLELFAFPQIEGIESKKINSNCFPTARGPTPFPS
jgi:hypothetical protein